MAHRGTKAGWGELGGLALALITLVFLLLWFVEQGRPTWPEAAGRILEARWVSTHYNAPPNENKVHLTYEYSVANRIYRDQWTGMWPAGAGPNPLPQNRLDVLRNPSFRLRVFYKPTDPAVNRLHINTNDLAFAYMLLSGVAAIVTVYYLLKIYPRTSALRPRV